MSTAVLELVNRTILLRSMVVKANVTLKHGMEIASSIDGLACLLDLS